MRAGGGQSVPTAGAPPNFRIFDDTCSVTPTLCSFVPLNLDHLTPTYNMSGIWAAYNKALAAQPLLVKAMTSFTGFTVGDILAQKFISPEDDYDFMRTLRLGGLSTLLRGSTAQYSGYTCSLAVRGTAAAPPVVRTPIELYEVDTCKNVFVYLCVGFPVHPSLRHHPLRGSAHKVATERRPRTVAVTTTASTRVVSHG